MDALDQRLRFAIANKRLIQISYDGSVRVTEPHDYGLQKGIARLLTFQQRRISGASGGSAAGWRLLYVAKIEDCVVLDLTFAGSRGPSHNRHHVWDIVYARVG